MKRASSKTGGDVSYWGFIRRNLVFHRTGNLLFCAGCAVGAIVLAGALLIGASLKESVRELHRSRIGEVRWSLSSPTGRFRAAIADSLCAQLYVTAAPILPVTGSVGTAGGGDRAHRVNIIGIDDRFWKLGPGGAPPTAADSGLAAGGEAAVINETLARRLGIGPGDEIVLRFHAAGTLAMDAPFGIQENPATLRIPVASVAGRGEFGDFSLKTEHSAVYNVFVPLELLQSASDAPGMASSVLIGWEKNKTVSTSTEQIYDAVERNLTIKDAGLNLRAVDGDFEIYSDRVFISEQLKELITYAVPKAIPVSAWFVNSIRRGEASTPYSFVSTSPIEYPINGDLIALNRWTAADLNADVGDTVTMTYFVPRSSSGLRLDSSSFVVELVHEDTTPWINRSLMPPYPGLAGASGCLDWNPSIPVDLEKIRPKDEEYWAAYGGTPKAIVCYSKASQMWANRFGVCTAIRILHNTIQFDEENAADHADAHYSADLTDVSSGAASAGADADAPVPAAYADIYDDAANVSDGISEIGQIGEMIAPFLTPAACGLRLSDVRATVARAVENGTDFAPLFAGLSVFTLAAALLLIWLMSGLQMKSRAEERLTLKRLGYSRRAILKIYMSEGLIVFSAGAAIGVLLAPLYTLAVIAALKTVWSAAAQVPELDLHIRITPLLAGGAAAFACAMVSMLIPVIFEDRGGWADARSGIGRMRRTTRIDLAGLTGVRGKIERARQSFRNMFSSFSSRVLIPASAVSSRIITAVRRWLSVQAGRVPSLRNLSALIAPPRTFNRRALVKRNIMRDKKRAAGEILILACALFILGITQTFRRDTFADHAVRSSGTGGFTMYGELNSGIPQSETGVDFLRGRGIGNVGILSIPARLKDGDDASCLNLNRIESPAIIGIDQNTLDSAGAFSFSSHMKGVDKNHSWRILGTETGDERTIYGIADANTVKWGLGKSIGDTLAYINDLGDTLNIILAAGLRNSILQGKIIIAESDFLRHFPAVSGYRLLLLSSPDGMTEEVAGAFKSFHDKSGLEWESAAERLNNFNAVENTYLSIFALLGMMGLMLGCAGLGITVMRDIEERRHEFAVMLTQGFTITEVRRLLFAEHAAIAAAGTLAGLAPAIIISTAAIGFSSLLRITLLVTAVLSCGIGSIALGMRRLREDDLVDILKKE